MRSRNGHDDQRPRLRGARVTLRPLDEHDAEAMFAIFASPDLDRLTGSHGAVTLEHARTWYGTLAEKEDRVDFGIVVARTDELIGEAVLNQIDWTNRSANFRILLDAARYSGSGYGSEATRLMLQYAFDELELHRVELGVFSHNPRAQHVYEKAGFRREGVRREALLWEGERSDEILMAILRPEWEAVQRTG
ncbi:MAG: GNAT family N-acetyltransferase [Trueperaceae bacterium]|nr:GNAT family N-acetyltransferase [Trueperaceae bacterium]